MNRDRQWFVQLEPTKSGMRATLLVNATLEMPAHAEEALKQAERIYMRKLARMRAIVSSIDEFRRQRRNVPARKVWELGDAIFSLKEALARHSLELDGLYCHLTRDLEVKQKWLEKVVILRRHLPKQEMIPAELNWGKCEKGTRHVCEVLAAEYRRRIG